MTIMVRSQLIEMTGDHVAYAIMKYLEDVGIKVKGPRTVKVNERMIEGGTIYLDPSAEVVVDELTTTTTRIIEINPGDGS